MQRLTAAAWAVTLELAPWLLLGAFVAGLLHVVLPPGFVRRHLRGRFAVTRAVMLGVPLPLCSCGVIPAGLGLRKQGASDAASVGFLIATPQTGVDSALVSGSMLGWPFALFKVVAAFVLGLAGGGLVDRLGSTQEVTEEAPPAGERPSVREGVAHGVDLVRSIWGWLVFGIVTSALLTVLVPTGAFDDLGVTGGVVAMVVMLLVSVPLYVCATASVPIAAALVAGGFPTGAALVFLMAGPATNLATLGVVRQEFGGRTLAIYLGTIVFGSIGAGLLFEWLPLASHAHAHAHAHGHGLPTLLSAVLLLGALGAFALESAWLRLRARRVLEEAQVIGVDGLTCNGCVRKLTGALEGTEGVESVVVVREPEGRATVQGAVGAEELRAAIRAAGFQPR